MDIKQGNILIAEPFMLDSHFNRSVILICEHDDEGTTGYVLNRLLYVKMQNLIPDFPKTNAPVYYGGPVATDSLHYLHSVGDLLENSVEVSQGVYWGGDFEKLKFLMENRLVKDSDIRFFVGYSGWEPSQLKGELELGTWIVDEMDANYLFRVKPPVLWQTVLHNKGNTYTVIAQMPDFVSLN